MLTFTFSRLFVSLLLLTTSVTVFGYGNGTYPGDSTSFNITSPNSPVVWAIGQTVNISWTTPADVSSQFTALDGYGCNVALFNFSDHSTLAVYISQSAVFSAGYFVWTIPSNFIPTTPYVVGVGFNSYVTGDAEITIFMPTLTSGPTVAAQTTQTTQPTQATQASHTTQTTQVSLTTAHFSSTSIRTQQTPIAATSSPQEFASVGGIGGLIGIVVGSTLVIGGILSIMAYNSFHERKDQLPGPGHGLQYAGEGSSYVPRSDESYTYVNDYDGAKAAQISSPPTSPSLDATHGSPTNRSTYIPFSKRNPNPHHDNIDLLQVDPFARPVPAYILASDSTERESDRQQRRRPSEPEGNRPYNFI